MEQRRARSDAARHSNPLPFRRCFFLACCQYAILATWARGAGYKSHLSSTCCRDRDCCGVRERHALSQMSWKYPCLSKRLCFCVCVRVQRLFRFRQTSLGGGLLCIARLFPQGSRKHPFQRVATLLAKPDKLILCRKSCLRTKVAQSTTILLIGVSH